MLTASDLADLRAVQAEFMPDQCQILAKPGIGRDQYGDLLEGDWEPVATVACRVNPVNIRGLGSESLTNAQFLTSTPQFEITVPFDTNVHDANRIMHVQSGTTFEISDSGMAGTFATARRVMAQQVGRG
jgi:hypothetical protein